MSFTAYEQSNDTARPIGLYHFRWGNSNWYYTSADRNLTVDGNEYVAVAISDDGLQQGGSGRKEFTVHCPAIGIPELVALFRSTPPSEPVYLVHRRKHEQDSEAPIHWIGKIGNLVRKEEGTKVEIICRNPGLKRAGLRLTWCRQCPHFIYDTGCTVLKSLFAETRTITALSGNSFTVGGAALPASPWFNGGFIEWDGDGLGTIQRRGVELTLGVNQYQMFGRTDGLTVGQSITLHPGCDGTSTTCDDKFDNLPNHGGLEFMPGKSPFDGTQTF